MKRLLVLICCLAGLSGHSQSLQENLGFYQYLINNKAYQEARTLLDMLQDTDSASINFYKGKTHYYQQQLDSAIFYLDQVTPGHPQHTEASFFGALGKGYNRHYTGAIKQVASITPSDSLKMHLRNYELAGYHLLNRDFIQFKTYSSYFRQQHYQFSKQELSFLAIADDLENHRYRSPALAGLYSALIPGLGRVYGGKVGMGIGTFLTTAVFGLQAWEAYDKDGPRSARFAIFGSLFSIFYIGNIWGSVFTVKIANDEFDEAVNRQIMLDLHIPLRTIYN